jgi:hypothetical protein
MSDKCSSKVIGREVAAGLNMTIDGTATAIGITVMPVPATAVAEAQAKAVAEDGRSTFNDSVSQRESTFDQLEGWR